VIRFGTMKFYVSRGHHVWTRDSWTGRRVRQWKERKRETKERMYKHLFIKDEEGRWKTPCGLKQAEDRFRVSEGVAPEKDVEIVVKAFLHGSAPGFFMRRCMKCVAWLQKNGESLIMAERIGDCP